MAETVKHSTMKGVDAHSITRWVVADVASLPTDVVADDVHKVAYVTAEEGYYGLINNNPVTWRALGGGGGGDVTVVDVTENQGVLTVTYSDTSTSEITLPTGGGESEEQLGSAVTLLTRSSGMSTSEGRGIPFYPELAPRKYRTPITCNSITIAISFVWPATLDEIRIRPNMVIVMNAASGPNLSSSLWDFLPGDRLSGSTDPMTVPVSALLIEEKYQPSLFGQYTPPPSDEVDIVYEEATGEIVITPGAGAPGDRRINLLLPVEMKELAFEMLELTLGYSGSISSVDFENLLNGAWLEAAMWLEAGMGSAFSAPGSVTPTAGDYKIEFSAFVTPPGA